MDLQQTDKKSTKIISENISSKDGRLIALKDVWPFLLMIIAAAGTFFATKATMTTKYLETKDELQDRISQLEDTQKESAIKLRTEHDQRIARIEAALELSDPYRTFYYSAFANVHTSAFAVLESEFERMHLFFQHWKKPKITYSNKIYGPKSRPGPYEIAVGRSDGEPFGQPLGYNSFASS